MAEGPLTGRVAIVTGASAGIGAAIAETLAHAGAKVVLAARRLDRIEAIGQALEESGCEALTVRSDVTSMEDMKSLAAATVARFGGIDILINGATLFNTKGVLNMPLVEWRRQTDVMLTGAFLFTKHTAKQMIELGRWGNMINIISTAGHQGEPGNIGYGTSKGGLLNFTRSVAMELSEYGIRVNSLTPTATDRTEGLERAKRWGVDWPPPRLGERSAGWVPNPSATVPLRRLPSPSHYAKAAAFLASEEAEMITGMDLRVDAGAISKYWIWDPGTEVAQS